MSSSAALSPASQSESESTSASSSLSSSSPSVSFLLGFVVGTVTVGRGLPAGLLVLLLVLDTRQLESNEGGGGDEFRRFDMRFCFTSVLLRGVPFVTPLVRSLVGLWYQTVTYKPLQTDLC